MLEELLAIGKTGAAFDKHVIEIFDGEQFGSGFVAINPNSKVPALMDHSTQPATRIFESGAILLYLAKKFDAFLPTQASAQYAINRYTMETKRQFDVLNQHLAQNQYMCGDEYTIADIAVWPWFYTLIFEDGYGAAEFLQVKSYQHVVRWAAQVGEREPAIKGYSHRSRY